MNMFKSLLTALVLSIGSFGSAFAGAPVDVNTADAAALAQNLDGIGEAKARAIVDYRQANGPFKSADELVNVKGIGLRTVEKNREFIQLGAAPAKPAAK